MESGKANDELMWTQFADTIQGLRDRIAARRASRSTDVTVGSLLNARPVLSVENGWLCLSGVPHSKMRGRSVVLVDTGALGAEFDPLDLALFRRISVGVNRKGGLTFKLELVRATGESTSSDKEPSMKDADAPDTGCM